MTMDTNISKKGRIPMGTNCAHLFTDLFLYCYESQFILTFLSTDPNILILNMTISTSDSGKCLELDISLSKSKIGTFCAPLLAHLLCHYYILR